MARKTADVGEGTGMDETTSIEIVSSETTGTDSGETFGDTGIGDVGAESEPRQSSVEVDPRLPDPERKVIRIRGYIGEENPIPVYEYAE